MTDTFITEPVLVAPSMMCADQLNFGAHAKELEMVGIHMWHMDIMDGHFAPNLSMALPQLEQFHPHTNVPFDIHLMVENNDLFVELCAPYAQGNGQIAVHVESCTHLDRTLTLIKDLGCKAGVAINPHTPIDFLHYELDRLDFVMVMTVNPGFAGQKLVPSGIAKIAEVRRFLDERGRSDIQIEVDGNVSFENIPAMVAAGGDILVAGTSSIFNSGGNLQENVAKMNDAAIKGLDGRSGESAEVLA